MDTLIILKEIQKIVPVQSVISFTQENLKSFNSNIDWDDLNKDFDFAGLYCYVQPLLIHQHLKGKIIFPHFRCLVQIEKTSMILLQDLTFEQWTSLS
jgi:hypothetical protein